MDNLGGRVSSRRPGLGGPSRTLILGSRGLEGKQIK